MGMPLFWSTWKERVTLLAPSQENLCQFSITIHQACTFVKVEVLPIFDVRQSAVSFDTGPLIKYNVTHQCCEQPATGSASQGGVCDGRKPECQIQENSFPASPVDRRRF